MAVLSAEGMRENVIHGGGNQTSDKAGVNEQPFVSTLTEGPSSSSICCVRSKEGRGSVNRELCPRRARGSIDNVLDLELDLDSRSRPRDVSIGTSVLYCVAP